MFTRASKEGAKVRLALFGPAGAGKTFTGLRVATGIGGRIALIDTERRTARKYADRFTFDVAELITRDIDAYSKAVEAAYGYNVLIIDSLTHAWQELLTEVEKLSLTKRFSNNKWSAWSVGTPKQRAFIDVLLNFPGHLIATMRSKTEWQTQNDGGKLRPVRVGLTPEQGKDIEFEFDVLMELSAEHVGTVIKDRSGRFQDQVIEKPGDEFGAGLAAWLADGAPPPSRTPAAEPAPSNVVPKPQMSAY